MLLRRYGSTVQSVEMNFDARALNEVGFRRDQRWSLPWEDFEAGYVRVRGDELTADAEGWVQDQAEQDLLRALESKLSETLGALGDGEVVLIESEQGNDYPKTRDDKKTVAVEGENRLYFTWRVEPPLRVGIYRKGA
jgi:hypothetical protein